MPLVTAENINPRLQNEITKRYKKNAVGILVIRGIPASSWSTVPSNERANIIFPEVNITSCHGSGMKSILVNTGDIL